ncbi:hypothetical protein GCM10009714_01660 [Microlunatus capsulatus]
MRAGARASSTAPVFLPSGLSPSVVEFHHINRSLAAIGSRTFTAGSDFHRPRNTCEFDKLVSDQCGTRSYAGAAALAPRTPPLPGSGV